MNKKIISGFLMFALAVFSMSSFVACKDYDEDSYDDLKARLNKEISLREAIDTQIQLLWDAIEQYKCKCDPSKFASKEEFDKALKRIETLEKEVEELKKHPMGGDTTIYIENPYKDEWIKLRLNDISDSLKLLNNLNSWIIYVENLAQQDSIDIKILYGKIDGLNGRIDSLNQVIFGWDTTLTNMYTRIDSIIQAMSHEHHVDTLYIGADSAWLARVDSAQKTADSALYIAQKALLLAIDNADRISTLERYVSMLVTQDDLAAAIAQVNGRINSLLDQMITGIIIQGTESPVIGYFNTPLDVRSQMLAAYYGEFDNPVKFPATTTTDLIWSSEIWSERAMKVMGGFSSQTFGGDGTVVSEKNGSTKGNAGTLYLTVNPANVDFTGKTLSLETSQANKSAIKLEKLAKSDRELTFGFTRANNGFYEAEATLEADKVQEAKMKINFTTLEDEAKDIIKQKSKQSVLNFAAALINSLEDVMPAYGVKASWSETGKAQTYDVYSQYSLAATAIKPLSFAFLKDFNANLPGEERVQNLFNKIVDKININVSIAPGVDFSKYQGSITFKDIDLSNWKNADGKILINIQYVLKDDAGNPIYVLTTNKEGQLEWWWLSGSEQAVIYNPTDGLYYWANGTIVQFQQIEINTDVDLTNILDDIIKQINNQFGANSDLAKNITDLLNDVASLGSIDNKINQAITDAKNDIKSVLNSYVTKAYNKLNHWISIIPNKALQPAIIAVKGDNKAGMLSRSLSMPTVTNSELTLIPTSYSLEMLAPAYKKFVAVTNVFDATTKAELSEADAIAKAAAANGGENMKTIIDGNKSCTLAGENGYIYEVSYSALDFCGKITTKKFYVQF